MFWKKKRSDTSNVERTAARQLYEYLCETIKKDGRIRAEDLISAAACVVAELCIEATGDFNPRKHQFIPGSRVFSTKVNEIFCGDVQDLEKVPADTVVGTLKDHLLGKGYNDADFPPLGRIFSFYAANIGQATDWGKVPLSIPRENWPSVLPLRVAYEARPAVDRVLKPIESPNARLRASVIALVEALIAVRDVIDKKIVLSLALETIHGMAKTAPMTAEAMASVNTRQS